VQATVGEKGHNVIRRAQELLSHQIPSGDLGLILEFVFTEFVERRENQKFGSTQRPRKTRTKPSKNPRHIPRAVRRAVRERDGDCCKYSSPDGKRCGCRKFLEFDHIVPIAKGGESTVENLRLVCRTHNQHAAEETFGAGFMETKRHATG
jgi:5-methylcytosine-specific restriction endonuclease McrA